MGAGGVAGAAGTADPLPLRNPLAAAAAHRVEMRVERLPAVAVVDHDHVAIADRRPTGEDDHPAIGRPYGSTDPGGKVDRQVSGPVVVARDVEISRFPNETAPAHPP